MSMIKKSITVTDKQNEWLQAQIELGLYASDSELLRDLIRQKQESEANNLRVQAIRAALIEGERSGLSKRTTNQIKQAVLERKRSND
jgi:antitoxin ParD1/3/4